MMLTVKVHSSRTILILLIVTQIDGPRLQVVLMGIETLKNLLALWIDYAPIENTWYPTADVGGCSVRNRLDFMDLSECSCRSGYRAWLEIKWALRAQVRILLSTHCYTAHLVSSKICVCILPVNSQARQDWEKFSCQHVKKLNATAHQTILVTFHILNPGNAPYGI